MLKQSFNVLLCKKINFTTLLNIFLMLIMKDLY